MITAYFQLPEMKNRSYREIDILFKRRVPARQWRKTEVSKVKWKDLYRSKGPRSDFLRHKLILAFICFRCP